MVLRNFFLTLVLLITSASSHAAEEYVLKFATLMPADTAWMKALQGWANEVKEKSNGRLTFKIYPGGVMGDEPDVLRKMRSGQLHGGAFTGYGIGRMFSPSRVLEVPFLFKNTDEVDYVRERLMPDIYEGFKENNYRLLGWSEVGFVYFFSKEPIQSMDDLKERRIWLWQGDTLGEAFFEASNLAPIPLSIVEVYTQLSTKHGSIDTVYMTPLGALAMQWHTKTKYITNIPMTNGIGGLIVSERFYRKLPEDLQKLLSETGKEAGKKITQITREDNEKSLELLRKEGMQFLWNWEEMNHEEIYDLRDRAAAHLAKIGYIPPEYFALTRQLLEEYRASHTDRQGTE